jgi:hypothetical protein
VVAVIDEQDRVVYCKRLANDLGLIAKALEPYREELQAGGSGVDLQLVLAGRWLDGGRFFCAFGQPGRDQAVRRVEVRRG